MFVFVCQLLICLACAIGSGLFEVSNGQKAYYLGHNEYTIPVYALRNFFTYFVLYNTMIPISLWVTLELIRVGQAKFMEWDELMGADGGENESACKAKTSNLNEDLGRIEHIFSDKTGTLTENMMSFCKCSVRESVFDEKNKPGGLLATLEYPTTPDETAASIADFLRILALCHTVVSEANPETGGTFFFFSSSRYLVLLSLPNLQIYTQFVISVHVLGHSLTYIYRDYISIPIPG